MVGYPVYQGAFKADVKTGLLGFDPFVLQDLFLLRLELPIECRVQQERARLALQIGFISHKTNREVCVCRQRNNRAVGVNGFFAARTLVHNRARD